MKWSSVLGSAGTADITLQYTALYQTQMVCTAPHHKALHWTVLHWTALHCTVLHCTALRQFHCKYFTSLYHTEHYSGICSSYFLQRRFTCRFYPFTLNTRHVTPHTVNCTLRIEYSTLLNIHCNYTLKTARCRLHTTQCKLYYTLNTAHNTHYILHPKHYILHTAHCTLHTTHYTLHTTEWIYLSFCTSRFPPPNLLPLDGGYKSLPQYQTCLGSVWVTLAETLAVFVAWLNFFSEQNSLCARLSIFSTRCWLICRVSLPTLP